MIVPTRANIITIPDDAWVQIASYLSYPELINFTVANKASCEKIARIGPIWQRFLLEIGFYNKYQEHAEISNILRLEVSEVGFDKGDLKNSHRLVLHLWTKKSWLIWADFCSHRLCDWKSFENRPMPVKPSSFDPYTLRMKPLLKKVCNKEGGYYNFFIQQGRELAKHPLTQKIRKAIKDKNGTPFEKAISPQTEQGWTISPTHENHRIVWGIARFFINRDLVSSFMKNPTKLREVKIEHHNQEPVGSGKWSKIKKVLMLSIFLLLIAAIWNVMTIRLPKSTKF